MVICLFSKTKTSVILMTEMRAAADKSEPMAVNDRHYCGIGGENGNGAHCS
jgi:hypothetical protein